MMTIGLFVDHFQGLNLWKNCETMQSQHDHAMAQQNCYANSNTTYNVNERSPCVPSYLDGCNLFKNRQQLIGKYRRK